MKILIVSDIHAYTQPREGGLEPSYVKVGDQKSSSVVFERLCREGGFPKVDVVVSPGDLGDCAEPACIEYAWKFMNAITTSIGNDILLATVGNHDVDSRFEHNEYDGKDLLAQLNPPYPSNTGCNYGQQQNDFDRKLWFWSENFYMFSKGKYRFIGLNSSAYHGMGKHQNEFEHGRVSDLTIRTLKKAIKENDRVRRNNSDPAVEANILLCHHHIQKDGDIDDKDYSEMKGAHALIDFLSDPDYGRWLVLHGHRHRARLFQPNGSTGPYVLSAGSFAATKDRDYSNSSPNQVHIVELDLEGMQKFQLYPAGSIETWTWIVGGVGWINSRPPAGGLPPKTGFGFRGNLDALTLELAKMVEHATTELSWDDIIADKPILKYLDYTQINYLKKDLSNRHQIELMLNENSFPSYLLKEAV